MRLKAVTKDLNEIKGQYSELDIQKFVEIRIAEPRTPKIIEKMIKWRDEGSRKLLCVNG
jgi:hypothetical protein